MLHQGAHCGPHNGHRSRLISEPNSSLRCTPEAGFAEGFEFLLASSAQRVPEQLWQTGDPRAASEPHGEGVAAEGSSRRDIRQAAREESPQTLSRTHAPRAPESGRARPTRRLDKCRPSRHERT